MGALGRLLGSSSTISGVASGLTSTASLSVSMGAPERKNGSCSGNRRMRRRGGVILAAMSAEQMQPATVRGEQMQPSTVRAQQMQPALVMNEQMQRAMCAEFTVLATITVRRSKKEDFKDRISNRLDAMAEILGRNVSLMLISTDIDLETKAAKQSIEAPVKRWFEKRKTWWDKDEEEKVTYTVEFTVDSNFGTPGAIVVTNRHQREFFLESIAVEGFASGAVHFNCNSWVQSSTKDGPGKRVFFSDKPYLPSETPAGLKKLREEELKALRGDGTGERKCSDRIYDFDTYNDLGNPDRGKDWVRPTLGGRDIPYPRRLRTGRPPMKTDLQAESRVEAPLPMYVPRDEAFEEGKQETLDKQNIKAILHVLVPSLVSTSEECHDFKDLHEMDGLYKVGLNFKNGLQTDLLKKIPFFDKLHESEAHFRYDTPSILTKDKLAWIRDDEFARQVVAGINPVSIERVKVFPPVSKLDPELYGPPESAIREEDIAGFLDGMSVADAVKENKLFILDYHDIFLPFLDRINSQDGRKSYATRTLFFLTSLGTLKPVAIELCLPPGTSESRLKRVLTPPVDATSSWIWQLAKAHVCSNDAGVHQLINHWLRTHASMEPFILAAHRQLSALHPIYKLLQPHMRYTLGINTLARQILINGKGVIESYFTPGSVSMEMSAAAYRTMYRFDQENLPDDLIRRGMAVPDPTQPHGLKLLMEDYPYANDGLMIWSAIENWVTTYVNAHYHDDASIEYDVELQHWYSEAVNVGHADVSDKPWWPRLSTSEDLIRILTTVIWVSSAQHAALNFGQYPLGGYMPNRPPLMRRLIPDETDPEYKNFLDNPEKFFLSCLPSMMQATKLMTVIDTLSTHSEDEEYLGERGKQTYSWTPEIAEAFNEYATEIRRVEEEIEKRNRDSELRNRCGAGVLPYQLLMPSSGAGITARGIPNSVTI